MDKKQHTQRKSVLPPVQSEDVLKEQSLRLTEVISKIGIVGLLSKIDIDTTGKVSTACWCFNEKTKNFSIKIGYDFVQILDDEELRIVLEHELLHHVRYRGCDVRNPLMSNIVLDIAINKTLFLYKRDVVTRLFQKLDSLAVKESGRGLKEAIADGDPGVLVYPILDSGQIAQIKDEDVKNAYIEIWGSRETPVDFNGEVPSPLTLYYKLVDFVPVDVSAPNLFGENDDADGGSEQEQSSESGRQAGKTDKKDKTTNSRRRRMRIESEKTAEPESKNDKLEENDNSEATSNNKQLDGEAQDDSSASDHQARETIESYADIVEETNQLAKTIENNVKDKSWGNTGGVISFTKNRLPTVNTKELCETIQKRIFEQTVDEIGHIVSETLGGSVIRQTFPVRPTRTTITHMACGITKYLPLYYNKTQGDAKPKIMSYIDVSGSMRVHMPIVSAIMARIAEHLPSVCYLFDTEIVPFPTQAWQIVRADGVGTNFDIVMEHILSAPNEKVEWFSAWQKKHNKKASPISVFAKYGLDGVVASEEYPAILWVTDGECNLSRENIARFQRSGKKLIVLMMIKESYSKKQLKYENNVFRSIYHAIYYINPRGEIVFKQGL